MVTRLEMVCVRKANEINCYVVFDFYRIHRNKDFFFSWHTCMTNGTGYRKNEISDILFTFLFRMSLSALFNSAVLWACLSDSI